MAQPDLLSRLRANYELWLDDDEQAREELDGFEASERSYQTEVETARRDMAPGAWSQALNGWWGRPAYPTLHARLEDISAQLLDAAAPRIPDNAAVLIDAWPGRRLQARTVRSQAGYAVLVDTAALPLIRIAAYAVATSIRRIDVNESPNAPPWGEDVYDDEAVAHMLALCIRRYLDGNPYLLPNGEFVGMRALLQESATHAAIEFLVAHELAHIAAGHLDDPCYESLHKSRLGTRTEGDVLQNINLEMDADELGAQLLVSHWERRLGGPRPLVKAAMCGPFVLLGLQKLVDHVLAEKKGFWGDTHPSAFMRAGGLLYRLGASNLAGVESDAAAIDEWMWSLRDPLLDESEHLE